MTATTKTPDFYRSVEGDTYYRSPSGFECMYWFMSDPDIMEYNECDIPDSAFQDKSTPELIKSRVAAEILVDIDNIHETDSLREGRA